ncbi:MAG: heliorhodopsin HeR [Candidatus Saccharibacteria bacterium]
MSKQISLSRLKKFNLFMGGMHFVQGVAVLLLSKDFLITISGSYLKFDNVTRRLVPASKELFDISLPLLIAAFLFISSVAHLIIATVYNKKYNKDLAIGINKARWVEYSISASIMMVAISLLVGIYDLMSLVMIFALTSIMNIMGLVMEVHNQTTKKTSWLSYIIGCISGAIPWIAVAFYFWMSANNGSKAPDFVYWIFVSIFIFFNCFAINMVLQYKKIGNWKNYIYGELVYIVLSLVAKSLLAWQVFAGTLRP